jgi:fucose 4-O-acetylase-like acetyltransferase
MNIALFLWSALCVAGLALSLRSAVALRSGSPWSLAGWLASALYFVIALADVLRRASAPFHLDYVVLAILIATFVVAGVRDERQAEPWWWPTHAGPTGRERRAGR